jgi:hypothetical protein
MRLRGEENGKGAREKTMELSGGEERREKKRTKRDNVGDGLALAGTAVGVTRECSRVKPSP